MSPNDTQTSPEPPIPISPEDDPKLQAIEALEARSIDPNPGPLDLDKLTQRQNIVPPRPVVAPKPIPVPTPKPVIAQPIPTKPVAVAPNPPVIQEVKKVNTVPKVPKTPAAEMAEELANVPSTRPPFQFFLHQKASRKQIGISIAIATIIIVGVGGYLGYKALQ